MQCRFCKIELKNTFVNLGMSPLCESYVAEENLNKMEPFYPLHVYVCENCYLVQLEEFVSPEKIFTEYAYFSSYATSWVEHAKKFTDMIVKRLDLNRNSNVVELASNDGYLLQHFLKYEIPVLGIEPALNVAKVAQAKNINTITQFFGTTLATKLAKENQMADLIIGNNVLAQVPDINDFVKGMKILLKPTGVITMEFPHLLKLIKENQFDTIYHEHFSYFSWYSVEKIFKHHGLRLFDVEQIPTHGGSLRIYACHDGDTTRPTGKEAQSLMSEELQFGVDKLSTYRDYTDQVEGTKRKILDFLIEAKRKGKKIAGYGAPGKGNTLLNYCGIRTDFLEYTVDRNPYKQGMYLPGTHIPIYHPDKIKNTRPDYVFILPWNFKDEIIQQNSFIREWGGQFVIPIPELEVIA
jgi:SAM-dependent methyltransferase